MEINVNIKFEDKFIKVLEGLGKVYAVIQPDKIDEGRQRAIEAAEAVQKTEVKEEKKEAPTETKAEAKAQPKKEKPTYTFEEIQTASANLARGGKRAELASLLKDFGVSSLPELKEEDYQAFAEKLKGLEG